jgi:tetratricopeptide (TPR) repeat protein
MIVKNESKIIVRMLKSVLPIIDTFCICDTGSTDGTVKIIQDFFASKNIQGTVVRETFVDFEHNRNFALKACVGMSDFVLLLDADMVLDVRDFKKDTLRDYDSCMVLQGSPSFHYQNMRIVRNNGLFAYKGVTHEYIVTPPSNRSLAVKKEELFINDYGDGGCKNDKFERDIRLLEKGILDEPKNDRYYFYLANSYHDSGNFQQAIANYKKRIELGGWIQEVWYSHYRIGLCYKKMNQMEHAISAWLDAFNVIPARLENLYEIIQYYRIISKHKTANMFYQLCRHITNRDDFLFLHNDVYTYKLDYEYTILAAYLGVKNINDYVITILNNSTDHNITSNLLSNMKFYKDILKPVKLMKLDDTTSKIINGENVTFNSSSSCLLPSENGYFINIRYVNYKIDGKGQYSNCDKHIITLNRFIEFTKNDFYFVEEKWFEPTETTRRYVGVEDVRIFNDIKTNQLVFVGTGFHEDETIGVVTGEYDITKDSLVPNEVIPLFTNSTCEKNWVFVEYEGATHLIYKWFPLQICISDKNNLYLVIEKQMPRIFQHARGSTCGFKYKGEIWVVVHLVSYEEPRHYYHMFAVFDESMNLLRYSAPFKFEGEPIEYCLSLVVEDDRLLINYSVWDRTTVIGVYDKRYVDSIVKYK